MTPTQIVYVAARDLDPFTRAYLVAALWSSSETDGTPLDRDFGIVDFAPETLQAAIVTCSDFQRDHAIDLLDAGDDEQNGHDLWLTRNHHGAGFWDRDYSDDVRGRLTDAAHALGEIDLYVGDDGKVHGE